MTPSDDSLPPAKKRKKERACDACRRRKTKCDGPRMAGHICSNCIQTRKPCTYVEGSKPRGPPKAYVTGLEDKLEALEALLRQIRPGEDFSDELGPLVVRDSWKNESDSPVSYLPNSVQHQSLSPRDINFVPSGSGSSSRAAPSTPLISPSSRTTHLVFPSQRRAKRHRPPNNAYRDPELLSDDDSESAASTSSSDTDEIVVSSVAGRTNVTLGSSNNDNQEDNSIRFHGRNTTAGLVESTRIFKHMHMKELFNAIETPRSPDNETVAKTRRPRFWARPAWEVANDDDRIESVENIEDMLDHFPPDDLAAELIELYFRHSNTHFPLLHRPTFDRQWNEKLHHRNVWFISLCSAVFAVASKWCNDRRVLPPACKQEDGDFDWTGAGRQYFELALGIHGARRTLFHPASLFEVQSLILMSLYLRSTKWFTPAWITISVGLRKAQDVGAHRKKVYRGQPTVDEELWKRAFWHLVVLDRIVGASLGRAIGVAEEDFDIEFPLEVDDEHWEPGDDREPFKQPEGIPSFVMAFNHFIKLTQIMAFALKTLYAFKKFTAYRGMVPLDHDTTMKQLVPALAEWLQSVPVHLRWGNQFTHPVFAQQAAMLINTYHLVEILIHRPQIILPLPPPPPSISTGRHEACFNPINEDSALTRCLQSARSSARVVERQLQHGLSNYYTPGVIHAAYICAGLLLLNAWNLKAQERTLKIHGVEDIKPPIAQRIDEDVADAKIFIRALEEVSPRWDLVHLQLDQLHETLLGLDTPPSLAKSMGARTHQVPNQAPHPKYTSNGYRLPMAPDHHHNKTRRTVPRPPHSIDPTTSSGPRSQPPPFVPSQSFPSFSPPSHGPPPYGRIYRQHLPHDVLESQSGPSHGRARAYSMSMATPNVPVGHDGHSLPYISSSMRRTSVPNLSARAAQDSCQKASKYGTRQQLYTMDGMRRDDVNMHFEEDVQYPPIQYAQSNHTTPKSSNGGHDRDYSRDGWDRAMGLSGWMPPITQPASSYVSTSQHLVHPSDFPYPQDPPNPAFRY